MLLLLPRMPINGAPSSAMTSGAKQSGTVESRFHQYQVVGRLKPSAQKGTRKSTIYKMNVFAPNTVVAKSRFWYYMSMLNRVKKANGEILQINEVIARCVAPAPAPASFLRASQAGTRGLSLVSRARMLAGRAQLCLCPAWRLRRADLLGCISCGKGRTFHTLQAAKAWWQQLARDSDHHSVVLLAMQHFCGQQARHDSIAALEAV